MTPVEIAVLVCALAFVVLVVFLINFLCTLCKTLTALRKQVEDLGHEPRDILHHTHEVVADVQGKMKCLDPLFHAISNVGEGLEFKTSAFKEVSICRCCKAKLDAANAGEENTAMRFMRLALVATRIWQDLQSRK